MAVIFDRPAGQRIATLLFGRNQLVIGIGSLEIRNDGVHNRRQLSGLGHQRELGDQDRRFGQRAARPTMVCIIPGRVSDLPSVAGTKAGP
jgi:hypothetical protein